MPTAELTILTTGDISRMTGVPAPIVRKILDRVDLGQLVGRYRMISGDDLDRALLALRAAGYDPKPTDGGIGE
jgi:hypothetical protein